MTTAADVPARLRASTMLRARGVRVTRPRVELLSYLLAEGHLSADALIERAAAADPPVHRATVYRTVEGLTQTGVLRHVHLSVGPTTYRVAEVGHDEPQAGDDAELYVQCSECGRLASMPVATLGDTAERVLSVTGFVLDPTHVALSGTCPDCTRHRHD